MRERAKHWASARGGLRFAATWGLAGLLQGPMFSWLVLGGPAAPPAQLAALHLASAALLFFAPPKAGGWLSPRRHWGESMALWGLAFPLFGWLAMGVLWFSWAPAQARQEFFRTGDQDDEPEARDLPAQERSEERRIWDATDIMPATDVLLGRDPTLKRGAIEALARIRSLEAIGWLLKARTDPDSEVRFHATAAITKLKRDFEAQMRAAESEVFENPADPSLQVALERVRAEYAGSGLLEERRRTEVLEGCRRRLAELVQRRQPGALELLLWVEKDSAPAQALRRVEELLLEDPSGARRWRREEAQLLFRLGRYAEVADRLRAMKADFPVTPDPAETPEDLRWRALIFWWCDA